MFENLGGVEIPWGPPAVLCTSSEHFSMVGSDDRAAGGFNGFPSACQRAITPQLRAISQCADRYSI